MKKIYCKCGCRDKVILGNTYINGHNSKGNLINLGRKYTQETKDKMSISRIGHVAWNKGGQLTEEHKQKISQSSKGKIISKKQREKISKAKKGLKFTIEHRVNISKAHIGKKRKPFTKEHKRKLRIAGIMC